ncbi:chromate efflux transporter [Leptospira sp. 201903075]|uniref:chromate efflux transporter n=1 Tax=Leptospira chreensis TaxID=2810035 RepID=UPI001964052F|nr:chromate efflux transporter [Leptospira chreensis]MBM9591179.1 chromate efflux transporter [Leptospira chreensis]
MNLYIDLFKTFFILGCTSFGGPVAHLGYFQNEFVEKKKWISSSTYADLVALSQFLPGPASSQVGIAIGQIRGGIPGGILAWFAFTLPSALLMIFFGLGVGLYPEFWNQGVLHGFKIAAVVVVAHAVWSMGVKLCPDKERISLAAIALTISIGIGGTLGQLLPIFLGGIFGFLFLKKADNLPHSPTGFKISTAYSYTLLGIFFLILFVLPLLANLFQNQSIRLFDSFFRVGSLVFGGGHVVLPLLKEEVVTTGLVSNQIFMVGYGAAQAIPGPLFTFTAYLGTVLKTTPHGIWGGIFCLVAAFLPAYLLIIGILPIWERFRKETWLKQSMAGINAVVVGLLISALYSPVWTEAIFNRYDFVVFALCFILLMFWKLPSWSIVAVCAFFGFCLNF